ncbi:hypothetical protein GCM10022243_30990 [Saccharothrix violaceirubra]
MARVHDDHPAFPVQQVPRVPSGVQGQPGERDDHLVAHQRGAGAGDRQFRPEVRADVRERGGEGRRDRLGQ